MTEGISELIREIGIAAAICGLMGWMMSVSARYRPAPGKGFVVGLSFGLLTLVPMLVLLPLLFWSDIPLWVDKTWLAATLAYEAGLGAMYFRHRVSVPHPASTLESMEAGYDALGLLKSDASPVA